MLYFSAEMGALLSILKFYGGRVGTYHLEIFRDRQYLINELTYYIRKEISVVTVIITSQVGTSKYITTVQTSAS